jgi:transmembrane sensor
MTSTSQNSRPDSPSAADFAEAAAWVARLHGPDHTIQLDRGLRRWLDASAAHQAALEAMTAAWEASGNLRRAPFPRESRWQRAGYRDGFLRSALAVAVLSAVVVGALFYVRQDAGISTGIGEQRLVSLDDGTRVFLNTSTRVVVKYNQNIRKVILKSGEALFDVAKDPHWPFVVEAENREVRALGTSFVVREDGERVSVTLVEGTVTVSETDTQGLKLLDHFVPASLETVTLAPGQRVVLGATGGPRIDQPAIESVTAWRRGIVDFQSTPLDEAIAEMNRYSTVRLTIEGSPASNIRVTGVFRTGDARSFADALARTYSFSVIEEPNRIRINATAP